MAGQGCGVPAGWAEGSGTSLQGQECGVLAGGKDHAAVWYFGEEKASLSELCTLHAGEPSACKECSVHLPYISVCCANE